MAPGQPTTKIRFEADRFTAAARSVAGAKSQAADRPRDEAEGVTKVWLGNLFDDRPHTPLAKAMLTERSAPRADFNDLGVSRVIYGGPPLVEIAPDIQFDFTSVGWDGGAAYRVANDGLVAQRSRDCASPAMAMT